MQRRMTQAERILRYRSIEFLASRPASVAQQRFVASKRAQPVARWRLAGGDPQLCEQIIEGAMSPNRQAGRDRRRFHEMKMGIDEARDDRAPGHLEQMGAGADHRLQLSEFAVCEDRAVNACDRAAFRMPEDYPRVKNQVGFIKRHLLLGSSTPPHGSSSRLEDETLCQVAISLKREAAW